MSVRGWRAMLTDTCVVQEEGNVAALIHTMER
jgi:hypothetical protein